MSADALPREGFALVTRTEYPHPAVRIRKVVGASLLLAAVPLLAILVAAGVDPLVVMVLVGGAVSSAFALSLMGSLIAPRAAVRLGLVDGQILIGTEDTHDVVRQLSDLVDVDVSRDECAETRIAPAERDLRVRGTQYVQLTFRDGTVHRVAILAADPVAGEIVQRLQDAVPKVPNIHGTRKARKTEAPEPVLNEPALNEPSASPAADVRLWEAARVVHRRVLSEYGAYELDPALFLRYPGVTDITRELVMDFHTALEDAQALATDTYPTDAGFAGHYRTAVDTLRRQWSRCERDGKATGTTYLASADRSDLDTAVKLYSHAQASEQPEEKASYLHKVQQIVVDLDGRGRVHLPRPVVAAIESQVRLALESGHTQ
jgi:hypothetical protein